MTFVITFFTGIYGNGIIFPGFFVPSGLGDGVPPAGGTGVSSVAGGAVTEGISYDHLKARLNIPCCKDVYYELYRRFFWILSQVRK